MGNSMGMTLLLLDIEVAYITGWLMLRVTTSGDIRFRWSIQQCYIFSVSHPPKEKRQNITK